MSPVAVTSADPTTEPTAPLTGPERQDRAARRRRTTPGAARPVSLSWWRRRSLRARLTAAATVVMVAGMGLASVLLVLRLQASLLANLDANASQEAATVADDAAHARLARPLTGTAESAGVVQVVDARGSVLTSSANVAGQPRLFTFPGGNGDPAVTTVQAAPVGEGLATYLVAAQATDSPSGPVTVYAALPTADATQSAAELVTALAVGVPMVTALLALIGWVLVGRALHPVDALRAQAAALPGTARQQRLEVPASDDELGRLAATFNALLGRIEVASERQTQFVADAAHELRSPLAALRAQLDVAVQHPHSAPRQHLAPALLQDAERLSRLVDDLLQLARLDAHPHPHRQTVDLDDLVLDEAHRARGRGPHVSTSAVGAGRVLGDPHALGRVVSNLLDNAVRHARQSVWLELTSTADTVRLVVADDGPGIPEADRERVFERFTRLDDARNHDAGGSGLGLAIVKDVVTAHGGRVAVTPALDARQSGAVIVVLLPASG